MTKAARDASVWRNPEHPYWRAPRGVWLIARTPLGAPYPCRCAANCGKRCPCRGRTDGITALPPSCCARRAHETRVRQEGAP